MKTENELQKLLQHNVELIKSYLESYVYYVNYLNSKTKALAWDIYSTQINNRFCKINQIENKLRILQGDRYTPWKNNVKLQEILNRPF